MAWVSLRRRCSKSPILCFGSWSLVPEEIARSSGKRAEKSRLVGQQADTGQTTRGSCSSGQGLKRLGLSVGPLSKGRAHF